MRFVFVHGGFHAAWCWDYTIAELERRGHEAVAVDLPGHGARVDDALDTWTIPNRRDAIVKVLRPGDVLVGHSGGGFDAKVAADAATGLISHVVYLAAALPRDAALAGRHRHRAARRGAADNPTSGCARCLANLGNPAR